MRRSVSSSSCEFFSTSAAFACGTTATPFSSAVTMSPGLTGTLAQVTGTLTPVTREWLIVVDGATPR